MFPLHVLRNVLAKLEPSLTFTGTHGEPTDINRLVSWLLNSTAARWRMENEGGARPIVKGTKKLLSRNSLKSYPAAMKAPSTMVKTLTMMLKEYCFLDG